MKNQNSCVLETEQLNKTHKKKNAWETLARKKKQKS